MKRVVSIDGIVLDNPLFISSEFDIDNYMGSSEVAIDGSSVVFVQAKGAFTKQVQVYSKTSGWISEATKDSLSLIVDTSAKILVFDDASSDTYYFDHSKTPLKFISLYEGSLWYTTEINLLKG